MRRVLTVIVLSMVLASCAASEAYQQTLRAPAGTIPSAAAANEEGNKLYKARQWEAAKVQYEAAIQAQPTLAEAHYNLGLVYDALRDDKTARKHFVEAANLAPGNKVIWDSPALRRHGDVDTSIKGGIFSPDPHQH